VLDTAHYPRLLTLINGGLRMLPRPWLQRLIPLDEETLFEKARAKAAAEFGCSFDGVPFAGEAEGAGEGFWHEGLRNLLLDLDHPDLGQSESAAEIGGITPLGRFMAQQQIVGVLATQLKVNKMIERVPDILTSEEVLAPLVLTGLPRTGTTFLHRALAVHPELRFLPLFEAQDPVASPLTKEIGSPELDARVQMADGAMALIGWMRPLFKHMHTMVRPFGFSRFFVSRSQPSHRPR
jgi:hypothetical protein